MNTSKRWLGFLAFPLFGVLLAGAIRCDGISDVGDAEWPTIIGPDRPRTIILEELVEGSRLLPVEFIIENRTPFDAQLDLIGRNCDCVAVVETRTDRQLNVGDRVQLPRDGTSGVEIQRRLKAEPGRQSAEALIRVRRSDGAERAVRLASEVHVLPKISVEPAEIRLCGPSPDGARRSVPVRVIVIGRTANAAGDSTFRVEENVFGWSLRSVVPQALEQLEPGLYRRSWGLNLTLDTAVDQSTASQQTETELVLQRSVALGRGDRIPIRVIWAKTQSVVCPSSVHFGVVRRHEEQRRRVLLASRDGRPFQVIGQTSTDGSFVMGAIESKAAPRHWLDILCIPKDPGRLVGRLVIQTDHPEAEKVTIDLNCLVVPSPQEQDNASN